MTLRACVGISFAVFIGVALAGCANQPTIATTWVESLRKLHFTPLYPPSGDMVPGRLQVVAIPPPGAPVSETDSRVPLDFGTVPMLEKLKSDEQRGQLSFGSSDIYENNSGKDCCKAGAVVAFPTFVIARGTVGHIQASIPIKILKFLLGFSSANQSYVTVTIHNAQVVRISIPAAIDAWRTYCRSNKAYGRNKGNETSDEATKDKERYKPDSIIRNYSFCGLRSHQDDKKIRSFIGSLGYDASGKPGDDIMLRMAVAVFYAKQIAFTYATASSFEAGFSALKAAVATSQSTGAASATTKGSSKPSQKNSGGAASTVQETMKAQQSANAASIKIGTIKETGVQLTVTKINSKSIVLQEKFTKPIAIGARFIYIEWLNRPPKKGTKLANTAHGVATPAFIDYVDGFEQSEGKNQRTQPKNRGADRTQKRHPKVLGKTRRSASKRVRREASKARHKEGTKVGHKEVGQGQSRINKSSPPEQPVGEPRAGHNRKLPQKQGEPVPPPRAQPPAKLPLPEIPAPVSSPAPGGTPSPPGLQPPANVPLPGNSGPVSSPTSGGLEQLYLYKGQ